MLVAKFTPDEKIAHLLSWASEWNDGGRGRSMWAYSLSLGASHALLHGWSRNEKVINLLSPDQRKALAVARRQAAAQPGRARVSRPVR